MTKFVKMSLAAAVAVAGLTSTAAGETSYSGKLYVENYTKTESSSGPSIAGFEIDVDVTAKTKINDMLTATVTAEADTDQNDAADGTSVGFTDAYFTYANMGAAVMFGRQGINTPTTDGETGEGILATYTMGDITVAGAHFANNNLDDEKILKYTDANGDVTATDLNAEATALAVLGSAGPVNFEAWHVAVSAVNTNTTLALSAKVGPVTVAARSATTSWDSNVRANGATTAPKDGSTVKASVSGAVSGVSVTGLYYSTDKDGAAFTTDASSANAAELAQLAVSNAAEVDLIAGIVSAPITDKTTGIVKYGLADVAKDEASELVLQVNHKLAKSTTTSFRYSDYTYDAAATPTTAASTTDKTHMRVDVTYKF